MKKLRKDREKISQMAIRVIQGLSKHMFLYSGVILAVMAAVSVHKYQVKDNVASTYLTLNYEEAAQGLYPNSTRFNISLIKSEPVLERLIEKGGFEDITVQEIADNITANGINVHGVMDPERAAKGEYRIATSYEIVYTKNPSLGNISAQEVLDLLMQSYEEVFYENYTYSHAELSTDWEECENLEYKEIGDFLQKESSKIQRYLKSRIEENGTFRSDSTNETFTSLKKLIDNFINVDLEKYVSYVTQSGLSKNRDRYVDKLNYENFLLDIDYQKFSAEYENHLKAIDLYDSALTAVVLVPTVDTEDEFYMSRTKVAIDYQAEQAESADSNANNVKEIINTNEYIIGRMEAVTSSSEQNIEKAENMIADMKDKLTDIVEKTEITNRDYVRYKTKNYLTVSNVERSLMDKLSVKWMLAAGGAAFGIICLGILLIGRKRGRK